MALADYFVYDTDKPVDSLIAIATKHEVIIDYLPQGGVTKSEVFLIQQAELTAMQSDPEYVVLSSEDQIRYIDDLAEKYRVLYLSLQRANRATFRNLWTKAHVERRTVMLTYERDSDGVTGTYELYPYRISMRGRRGDLYYAGSPDFEGTKSFLVSNFITLQITSPAWASSSFRDQFRAWYPTDPTLQSRYDRYLLANIVIDMDVIHGDTSTELFVTPDALAPPVPSVLGIFPYTLETETASYYFQNPFLFITAINDLFSQLLDKILNDNLELDDVYFPGENYVADVKQRLDEYLFFAEAYNSFMSTRPSFGTFTANGPDLWYKIKNDARFSRFIENLAFEDGYFCAMLAFALWPAKNKSGGYGNKAAKGEWFELYLNSMSTSARAQREQDFVSKPGRVIGGLNDLWKSYSVPFL